MRHTPSPPALLAGVLLAVPGARPAPAQARFALRHEALPVLDEPTEALVLCDLDHDGDLDLVLGYGQAPTQVFLNDGLGVFAELAGALPAHTDPTDALLAADFDSDGHLDLLVGNGYEGWINRLYLGDGTGFFAEVPSLPPDEDGTEDADAGDVDGDGDLDLFLGSDGEHGGQQDRLYLNDGAAVFTDAAAAALPADADETEDVALADLDGDGDLDAVAVNDMAQNRLYLGDGAGAFADATGNLPADADQDSEALVVFDADLDGDLDLFVGNSHGAQPQNRLYANDGPALFADATPASLPADRDDTEGLAAGDLDADGDPDVVAVNFFWPDQVYLNDGAGSFAFAPPSALPPYHPASGKVELGDVDGDGDLDAVMTYNQFETRLLLNDGAGNLREPAAHYPPEWFALSALALADFDADGDLDLLAGDATRKDHLHLNDGAGVLSDFSAGLPDAPALTRGLAAGDLDGDGDVDAYAATAQRDALLLNAGGAVFRGALVSSAGDDTRGVALGDFDRDGDLDAATANAEGNILRLNDGRAAFAEGPRPLPRGPPESRCVAAGDVDGDGDLDLAFGHGLGAGAVNSLWLGDGAGGFADGSAGLPPDADPTAAVALGDVDGDGDLDLLAGNGGGGPAPDRLVLGRGDGTFRSGPVLPIGGGETAALLLADLDGDGDLDLVAGNGEAAGEPDELAWNDGSGAFAADPGALPAWSYRTPALAAGDLDGDGDRDLVLGHSLAQPRVLLNLSSQLSWRAEPRIGRPLSFALAGRAGTPWLLAYSTATRAPSRPPFDPAPLRVAGAGCYGAGGASVAAFAIPEDPALAGLVLPWRALGGAPPALGNLELTRFSDP